MTEKTKNKSASKPSNESTAGSGNANPDDSNREADKGGDQKPKKSPVVLGVNWRWVDYSIRGVLMVAIVYMVFSLGWGFFAGQRTPEKKKKQKVSAEENRKNLGEAAPSLFMADFLKGNWTVGESKWKFNSRDYKDLPGEDAFAKKPTQLRERDPLFNDDQFIQIFKSFNAKQTKTGDLTYWRATGMGVHGSMYTKETKDGPVVQLFRVAFPANPGYAFAEGMPSEFATGKPTRRVLLPLCEGAEQLAFRSDEKGVVSSAILNYQGQNVDILKHWEENGWDVKPIQRAGSPSEQFQCVKQNVVVIATFMSQGSRSSIMLVRVPD